MSFCRTAQHEKSWKLLGGEQIFYMLAVITSQNPARTRMPKSETKLLHLISYRCRLLPLNSLEGQNSLCYSSGSWCCLVSIRLKTLSSAQRLEIDLKLGNYMAIRWVQGVYYGIHWDITTSELPTPWMSVKWHDHVIRTWFLPPRCDTSSINL
jgi:hypothetical protein